jgi:hypothetical protein
VIAGHEGGLPSAQGYLSLLISAETLYPSREGYSLNVMAGTTILLCILLCAGVNGSIDNPLTLFFRLLVRLLDALLLLCESTELQARSMSDELPSARGN